MKPTSGADEELLLGRRAVPRLGEEIAKVLGVLAPPRWRPVAAADVARALIAAAKEDVPGTQILENRALRASGAVPAHR